MSKDHGKSVPRWLLIAAVLAVGGSGVAQWVAFARNPITTDDRLILAKAARPDVPVYHCSNDRPRSWEERPPDPDTQPHAVVLAQDFLVAESLEPTTEGSDQWAKVTGVWCEEVPGSEARLEFWGACVRWDDLRPASLDEIGLPKAGIRQGPVTLCPPIRRVSRDFAVQYATEPRPTFAVTRAGICSIYQTDQHGGVKVMVAKEFKPSPLWLQPVVRIWPRSGGLPDVLTYQPPAAMVCWRSWDGTMHPALPAAGEFAFMLYMFARGWYAWWLPLGTLVVFYLAGLRLDLSTAKTPGFVTAIVVLLVAAVWSTLNLIAFLPLVLGGLALYNTWFRIIPRHRRLVIAAIILAEIAALLWVIDLQDTAEQGLWVLTL